MDCDFYDIATSIVLITDADHTAWVMWQQQPSRAAVKVSVMNTVAAPKMNSVCMIGFRKQDKCPGKLIQVTQIPKKIAYAKAHICHALCIALAIIKDYFSLNIKGYYC